MTFKAQLIQASIVPLAFAAFILVTTNVVGFKPLPNAQHVAFLSKLVVR